MEVLCQNLYKYQILLYTEYDLNSQDSFYEVIQKNMVESCKQVLLKYNFLVIHLEWLKLLFCVNYGQNIRFCKA